jgi:hypothetical protein
MQAFREQPPRMPPGTVVPIQAKSPSPSAASARQVEFVPAVLVGQSVRT